MSLYGYFLSNNERVIFKWLHYFPIYEKHFAQFVNRSIVFFEIGVYKGGSLQMWKKYLGPYAQIIGIDINPACKTYEEPQIHVEIGDQKDRSFLASVINRYGAPDIVLDDGSHIQSDICATFDFLYPLVRNNGVYLGEDLHTSYWPKWEGGLGNSNTFIEKTKRLVDSLNAWHYMSENSIPEFTNITHCISYYDSICVFEKMIHPRPQACKTGKE